MVTIRHTRILRSSRRGAVLVFFLMTLVVMVAFVAFCVDIGWITKTKTELQNAADASVAAGARQLADNYSAYLLPGQKSPERFIASAKTSASTYVNMYGNYNAAGDAESLNILPTDITYGFTDAKGIFDETYGGYPNTVQVVVRRDASANSPLNLFFGGILGRKSSSLTASAKATIYTGLINAFAANAGEEGGAWGDDYEFTGGGYECSLLPVAFDVNSWNRFFETGLSPDGINYTDSTGAAQIQIYPSPHQAPGNFGLLCIGNPSNSTGSYSNWILNGPSADDLQYLVDNDAFPVSQSTPKDWKGSPGLKSVLGKDFAAIIGQPRLLPLFEPASSSPYQAASGVGSNASYRIVGFVGVTVTVSSGMGANLTISVKPCDVFDPSAVFDPSTLYPLGAQPANQLKSFTCAAPKLTK